MIAGENSTESSRKVDSLAVVVPSYNEAETIRYSHARLCAALRSAPVGKVEIIYVNDGSRDESADIFREILEAHTTTPNTPHISLSYIEFSRNFGHSSAVLAGLETAEADAVAIIDADLQDPPELIPEMLAEIKQGWDVVFGQRKVRETEGPIKRFTAWAFYRVLRILASFDIPADTGDFRVITRQVRDAVLECRETEPFLRGLIAWVGYRQKAIPYVRSGRKYGSTKYPFRKMARFASMAILSFSTKPLRMAAWLGALGFFVCCSVGVIALVAWARGIAIPGWTSLVVAFMTVQSFTLIIIGILGAYVGRIYSEVQQRPRHLIRTHLKTSAEPKYITAVK